MTLKIVNVSGFSPLKMMILLGNKQNSLILLGVFSFSRMEIPVYNLGECTPWVFHQALGFLPIILEMIKVHSGNLMTFTKI